jgi:hypothetical protein
MALIYINGEQFAKCEYCGNIWDGYAQCNCGNWQAEVEVEVAAEVEVEVADEVTAEVEVEINQAEPAAENPAPGAEAPAIEEAGPPDESYLAWAERRAREYDPAKPADDQNPDVVYAYDAWTEHLLKQMYLKKMAEYKQRGIVFDW